MDAIVPTPLRPGEEELDIALRGGNLAAMLGATARSERASETEALSLQA